MWSYEIRGYKQYRTIINNNLIWDFQLFLKKQLYQLREDDDNDGWENKKDFRPRYLVECFEKAVDLV